MGEAPSLLENKELSETAVVLSQAIEGRSHIMLTTQARGSCLSGVVCSG